MVRGRAGSVEGASVDYATKVYAHLLSVAERFGFTSVELGEGILEQLCASAATPTDGSPPVHAADSADLCRLERTVCGPGDADGATASARLPRCLVTGVPTLLPRGSLPGSATRQPVESQIPTSFYVPWRESASHRARDWNSRLHRLRGRVSGRLIPPEAVSARRAAPSSTFRHGATPSRQPDGAHLLWSRLYLPPAMVSTAHKHDATTCLASRCSRDLLPPPRPPKGFAFRACTRTTGRSSSMAAIRRLGPGAKGYHPCAARTATTSTTLT